MRTRNVLRFGALRSIGFAAFASSMWASSALAQTPDRLDNLSIEDLANVEVTSVSRRAQPVGEAPASVFVITGDDIDRGGIRSIPAALRLAPNLQVARIGASEYGITSRGFNHSTGTANKLLVLVDGRIVYTPLFSGVFWDEQNPLMEDLDRIEVIGGPGGTLWGTNAVNGVINIVSRDAHETTGLLVTGGGGNNAASLGARYGARFGNSGAVRVYGVGLQRGRDANEWQSLQGGFRSDWSSAQDTLTFQGDIYQGDADLLPSAVAQTKIDGGNLLARWSRRLEGDASFQVQAYVDRANRQVASGIRADVDSAAIDLQSNFDLTSWQQFVIGAGVRVTSDEFRPGPRTTFTDPAEKTLRYYSAYAQDTLRLAPSVDLILGLKLENNDYTGLEYLPNARLSWRIGTDKLAWASVSRAVRTPSRFDRDLINPGLLAGGPTFDSEEVIAYEAGYRAQPSTKFWFSASVFYNEYDDLRTVEASSATVFPLVVKNGMRGETYGVEAWGAYAVSDWWRLNFGLSLFDKNLSLQPGSADVFGVDYAGNDPHYQATLRSLMDIGARTELDVSLRAIDDLPSPAVPSYAALDARLGFRLTPNLELSLAGYNLLDDSHVEFINPSLPATVLSRSFFISARWRR